MENSNKKPEISEEKRKENLELFKRAINEALSLKFDEIVAEAEGELPEPSRRHKLEMNRILREATNGSFIPFPEVDE